MKTNSHLILHHILWRGLYFLSILIVNILIARFFTAEKSGQVFYIVNNLALILLAVSLCLESGFGYYLSAGKLPATTAARFCLVWTAGASVTATAIWWLILYASHSVYNSQAGFLLMSFLFISGVLMTTFFTAIFYASKEFAKPNQVLFLTNILLILLLVAGRDTLWMSGRFIQLYFFFFFLQGVLLVLLFFYKEPIFSRPVFPDKITRQKIFTYSFTALLANGLYFLVNRVDYWFVQYYYPARDLGNYIQASKLGQMLLVLPGIIGATLFPIFSSSDKSAGPANTLMSIRILLWINLLICFVAITTGWFFFPLVYGRSFNDLYVLFILLIPGILAFTMNYPIAAWFSSVNRTSVHIASTVLALTVLLAGDIFILPGAGFYSAPVISSVGYSVLFCFTLYKYRKQHRLQLGDIFLLRRSDIIFLRAAILKAVKMKTAARFMTSNAGKL